MEQDKRLPQNKRILWRIVISLLAAITFVLLYYTVSSLFLRVENISISADIVSPIRIVHLSDLHNAQFGKNNTTLVRTVANQEPDLIIMSGDMLNRNEENTGIVISLISDLSQVAPVYYGYGNHEKDWEQNFQRDLRPILVSAGAIVVDNDYLDLSIRGTDCRIGGYMGYYGAPHMTTKEKAQQALERSFTEAFQTTSRLKLLINHIPTGWVDWNYVDKYDAGIVFSGHYHGGTMRIPILDRGLYAPYVGWFPPFTKGVYSGTHAVCIVSAGLGTEYHIPRINNPPEIVVVDLKPNKS